jgi:AraC-like DNA-binding protein
LSFVGLMTTARAFHIDAGTRFFGIRFRPGMARAFLGERATLTDCALPLNEQRPERRLFEQLAGSVALDEMNEWADAYLGDPRSAPNAILEALARGPAERVTELETLVSPRHLRRLCLEQAGVSPKHLMRILRFRRAVERLGGRRAQVNWADFAAACGYYDQAHMIREFQDLAGTTPGRFLQSLEAARAVESAHEHQT